MDVYNSSISLMADFLVDANLSVYFKKQTQFVNSKFIEVNSTSKHLKLKHYVTSGLMPVCVVGVSNLKTKKVDLKFITFDYKLCAMQIPKKSPNKVLNCKNIVIKNNGVMVNNYSGKNIKSLFKNCKNLIQVTNTKFVSDNKFVVTVLPNNSYFIKLIKPKNYLNNYFNFVNFKVNHKMFGDFESIKQGVVSQFKNNFKFLEFNSVLNKSVNTNLSYNVLKNNYKKSKNYIALYCYILKNILGVKFAGNVIMFFEPKVYLGKIEISFHNQKITLYNFKGNRTVLFNNIIYKNINFLNINNLINTGKYDTL